MTWPKSSRVRGSIAKIAVAGVLLAIPTAAVVVSVHAMPGFGGTLAAPSTDAPAPPPPAPPPVASDYDWWSYGQGDGGAGGGGGG